MRLHRLLRGPSLSGSHPAPLGECWRVLAAACRYRVQFGTPWCAGFEDEGAKEMMRLYQTIHTDHEVCSSHFMSDWHLLVLMRHASGRCRRADEGALPARRPRLLQGRPTLPLPQKSGANAEQRRRKGGNEASAVACPPGQLQRLQAVL